MFVGVLRQVNYVKIGYSVQKLFLPSYIIALLGIILLFAQKNRLGSGNSGNVGITFQ
jgi:hypothetical protein